MPQSSFIHSTADNSFAKEHTFVLGLKKDAKILKKSLNIPLNQAQQNLLEKFGFSSLAEVYQKLSVRINNYLHGSTFSFKEKHLDIKIGLHEINQNAFIDPGCILHIFTVGFNLKKHFQSLPVIPISEFVPEKFSHVTYILVDSEEELEKYNSTINAISMQGRSINARLLISLPSIEGNIKKYANIFANTNIFIAPKATFLSLNLLSAAVIDDVFAKYCPFIAYTINTAHSQNTNIDYFLKA